MSQKGESINKSELLNNTAQAKRRAVTTACQSCRRKKVKCDGKRPCSDCARRNVPCEYTAQENETPQQALKRKFDDLSQLYEGLASQDEGQALETLRLIRAGDRVESILRNVHGRENEPIAQRHRRALLLALLQSTASLEDVVKVASSVLSSVATGDDLPPASTYEPLKNTVATVEDIYFVLNDGPSLGLPRLFPDGTHDGPQFWVPASPWTKLTDDDEAVSHLVSLYLCFINPFNRLVEEDAFLRAMRSRKPSAYCSPLLVHAILAMSSLYSDIDAAFSTPGKMLTRGEHYHREALRLLELEEQQATISSIQAIVILSVESARRGNDKLGLDLTYRAGALIKSLPTPESHADAAVDALATRVRSCLTSTVVWLNFAYIHAMCYDSDTLSVKAQDGLIDVVNLLPDRITYWTGFPLLREPLPFRINLLLEERTKLVPIMAEMSRPHASRRTQREILDDSSATAWSLHEWYEALPQELSYSRKMPSPVYELHCHFIDLNMGLYNRALKQLASASDSDDTSLKRYKEDLQARSILWAHRSARLAEDFRVTYSYKIVPPFVVHSSAVAALILLRSMKGPATDQDSRPRSIAEMQEIEDSFAQCFRCLIGTGLQEMFARGVARMVYCTSVELGTRLPDSVQQTISLVADSAWQPSDTHQYSSTFPNWATSSSSEVTMEEVIRKWQELAISEQGPVVEGEASSYPTV